jgi:hypothetical protein
MEAAESFEVINIYLPNFLSSVAIIVGIAMAFQLATFMMQLFAKAFRNKPAQEEPFNINMDDFYEGMNKVFGAFSSKKKSYEDEMSIYDDVTVQQPQRLPQQTGLSLEDLFTEDGEISDAAFMEKRQ